MAKRGKKEGTVTLEGGPLHGNRMTFYDCEPDRARKIETVYGDYEFRDEPWTAYFVGAGPLSRDEAP